MPPRKKPNPSSTSRKSNPKPAAPPPPPSKFGIQHFFERHTQTSSTAATQTPTEITSQQPPIFIDVDKDDEDSPEVSKSKTAVKRFKFSPGMLIKQSQDDGDDEVTWKTSPEIERLTKAVSRLNPETIRVLADTSRLKGLSIGQCSSSYNKGADDKAGQVENSVSLNRVGVKRVKPDQDVECNGSGAVSEMGDSQSPFRTPPSLSYCHDKLANALSCDGVSGQPGMKRRKYFTTGIKVGRSSGLTTRTIMAYAIQYNDQKGICFLTDFFVVGENHQTFDLEGDSGSLILLAGQNGEKPRPVGIIWGGTANRGRLKLKIGQPPENWTSGVDLGRLLDLLELDLITTN